MKTLPRRLISTLVILETVKAVKRIYPVRHLHLVGSRLRHLYGRDLDFVAVTNYSVWHGKNATLKVGAMSVNLFFTLDDSKEAAILEFGMGLDLRWKTKAKTLGFRLGRYGLFKGSRLITNKMAEIAKILGFPLKSHLVWTLNNPL